MPPRAANHLSDLDLAGGTKPLFRRLATAIEQQVVDGRLPPGSALPAERQLASSLGISRVTVVAAYEVLREAGIIERRRGSGTRVARKPPGASPWVGEHIRRLDGYGPIPGEFVGQTGGAGFTIAALPATPAVDRAFLECATTSMLSEVERHDFGYSSHGLEELRAAIASRFEAEGVPTEPDQVLITGGAQQALSLLSILLVGPGAPAVVEDPTYAGILDALRAVGAMPVGVPVDGAGIQTDPLSRLLRQVSPRLIYTVPAYQNPTGVVLTDARAQELAHIAERFRVPLIDDRSLAGTGWGSQLQPPHLATLAPSVTVTVGSLSKLTWGGLRIGWIRGERSLVDQLARLKLALDHGTSLLSQMVAVHLLRDIDALSTQRCALARERYGVLTAALRSELPEWSWTRPAGGLSVWVRLPDTDATAFAAVARRFGAIVVPGPVFSAGGQHRDRVRLTFGAAPEAIARGVALLAASWQAWRADARPTVGQEVEVVV